MLNLLAPQNSRRRKFIKKFINRRRLNFKKNRYNSQRVNYYKNSVRLNLTSGPLVSIIVPAYNTPARYLGPLLDSIYSQGYENWELVLVNASNDKDISDNIAKCAQSDTRITYIKIKNKGIAYNTNIGINKARGEFIALLDHDDTLDPDALARAMQLFIHNPELGLVYSDEDKISENGDLFFDPHFKPDFSLNMLRSVNYITHFVVVKSLIAKDLLIQEGFEGAQDYDFLLRVVDKGVKIGHAIGISYHWRQAHNSTAANFSNKKNVTDAGVKALKDHYARRKINNVEVSAIPDRPGFYRSDYTFKDKKKRAICIALDSIGANSYTKNVMVELYKNNQDVIDNRYDILTDITKLDKKRYASILYVNDTIIPENNETSLSNLFALAEEDGVFGVQPRVIINPDLIYDIGLVRCEGFLLPLGRNVSFKDFSAFGSQEWSRNVEGLSGCVVASSNNKDVMTSQKSVQELSIKSSQRKVICGDSNFIKLFSVSSENIPTNINYYNDNLSFQFVPTMTKKKYIEEVVEIEK